LGVRSHKGISKSNSPNSELNYSELLLMKLTRKEFEETVVSALNRLPKFIKKKMENVDVVVEPRASQGLLSEMGLRSPSELLGLYQGVPYDRRGSDEGRSK